MKSKYIDIAGCNIHYVEQGNIAIDNSTFVFLHGFPEYWGTWRNQLSYFAQSHHVIAPDLPGYNLSDKPEALSFYEVPNLIDFFAEFIRQISPNRKIILVAHDWGGAIAWPLAAFHSALIEKLVIINAAHPSTFTREMINSSEQREKSGYIHQLIAHGAEQELLANNCLYLQNKIFATMRSSFVTDELIQSYIELWQKPGVVKGMLNYYRAMPQLAPNNAESNSHIGPVTAIDKMKIPRIIINIPTLVLWGEKDQAFVIENLNQLARYVSQLTLKRFPKASHWLTHECSDEINQAISQFILPK
ncbi:alpha/beta hydrolase [Thalassotalea sp. M1531]|uniref:Alpha/beta hydrolase n=1 Tax=Thalassotalea algicola TaxID=2716224 RepID=A0A7Y0LBP3_9GAMM|nr:alpha/beta hydrolase [Thalassotalea algicola]